MSLKYKNKLLNTVKLGLKVPYLYIRNSKVDKNDIANSYDNVSKGYQDTYLSKMHIYNNQVLDKLSLDVKEGKILDLAGGTGYNCNYLKKINENYDIDLVDISKDMLSKCGRNDINKYCDSMLKYLEKRENHLKYDAVICTWALMYENPNEVLKGCFKILKDNGFLYILVNDKKTLPQVRKVYPKLLIKYVNEIKKIMMDLPTPRNKTQLKKWAEKERFKCVLCEEDKADFVFDDYIKAANFVTSTGALAGYDVMINLKREDVLKDFASYLGKYNDKSIITHHFVKGVFKKS